MARIPQRFVEGDQLPEPFVTGRRAMECLWPIRPKPLPDELLSSWMVRAARANGAECLETFRAATWPRQAVWNRDIDNSAGQSLLEVMAARTGTRLARVRETVLSEFKGRLFERHEVNGLTPWILSVGVYHRTRRSLGLQYCPQCLVEDADPYFRRSWRLALVTCCPHHRVILRNACHRCWSPIVFHRAANMVSCFSCAADLRSGPRVPATAYGIEHQEWSRDALAQACCQLGNYGVVHSLVYFSVLHQVSGLLASGRRSTELRAATWRNSGLPVSRIAPRFTRPGAPVIERLSPCYRHLVIGLAARLLEDWPERFAVACQAAGLRASDVRREWRTPPFAFDDAVRRHLGVTAPDPLPDQILAMERSIWQRGLIPTAARVATEIGVGRDRVVGALRRVGLAPWLQRQTGPDGERARAILRASRWPSNRRRGWTERTF